MFQKESLGIPKTVGAAFEDELKAIAETVKAITPLKMDGRKCVQEMREVGDPNWKQVQWQGFYFEMKAAQALTLNLGGGGKGFLIRPLTM